MNVPARLTDASAGRRLLPPWLLGAFAVIWIGLAIAPRYREDWLLENVLVIIAVPVLIRGYRRLPLSNGAYVALFVFMVLHEIGAHYTYSEVPAGQWIRSLLALPADTTFGFDRNHYDRVVHFLYGLLVTPAMLEVIDARSSPTAMWRWLLTVGFMTSHSVLYELLEWVAVVLLGGDLGMAYLGTQGDEWDAHKDMLLALLGSMISATILCRRAPRQ
jgi:putative membrane protein